MEIRKKTLLSVIIGFALFCKSIFAISMKDSLRENNNVVFQLNKKYHSDLFDQFLPLF